MPSKYKYIFLPILFFFSFYLSQVNAQTADTLDTKYYHPFTEYDSFLVDLHLYLEKGVRLGSDSIILDFESHWENGVIDLTQKEWIYKSTKRMHKNRLNYRKQAAMYYGCIMAFLDSAQSESHQFTRFLEIADTCLISYTPQITHNFFYKSRLFLEKRLIEKSKYTTIKVEGGSFEFTHELAAEGFVSDHMVVEINTEPEEEKTKESWYGGDEETTEDVAQQETSDSSGWGDDSSSSEENDSEYDWGDDSGSSEEYDWGDDSGSSEEYDWGDDSGSSWDSDDGSSDWGDSWDGDDSNIETYGDGENNNDAPASDYAFSEDCNDQTAEIADYDPGITDMPPLEGPMLRISEADLIITTKFDTALLEKTVGTLIFKNDTIVCQGGRFYWQNVEFSKDSAWCELPHFSFDTRVAYIEADHAEMHFSQYLDTIAIGAFTYKSGHFNKFPEKAIYPQFISYNNNYHWKNLPKDVELVGGFAIKGNKTVSRSVSKASSVVSVKGDSTALFELVSNKGIKIKDEGKHIRTKSSQVKIYYAGGDTITHPSVNSLVSVNDSTRNVFFRKTTDIYRFNPFTLSAQDVNVYADAIEWDLDTDSLDFRITGGAQVVPIIVESQDFFHPGFVSRIQGVKKFQPLMIIVNHSRSQRKRCFDAGQLAVDLKINEEQFAESLKSMAIDGLVEYDHYSQIVKLLPKAYQYYDRYFYASSERRRRALTYRMNFDNLSAMQEQALVDRDFDNLSIAAQLPGNGLANATLTLDDSTYLKLRKVPYFPISDSLNVSVMTDSAGLTIGRDREITFGGQFNAGSYIFRGDEFTFKYDSFLINLTDVDSINFVVKDSVTGKPKESPNPLVDTGGTLFINKSFNKSGLLSINGFPSFNAASDSSKGGRIYYDRPSVLNGAYDKRIVFELDTFTVDASVIHSDVSFNGTLNTGGIFPTFKDEVVMDPATGIFALSRKTNHNLPFADYKGWPIYVKSKKTAEGDSLIGKGHFDGEITLNHKGIRGNGELEYLGSEFKSEDFIFYSDSVTTHGSKGIIESKVHPRVDMNTYDMKWYVYRDSMAFMGSHDEPFTIYNQDIKFSGKLALLPSRVFGDGEVETSDSYNKSRNFRFQKDGYISRHSTFEINSNIEGSPSMFGNDIRVARNVVENKVLIRTENNSRRRGSSLNFPFVNFQTSINEALWDIDEKNIQMTANNDGKGKFISNEPAQDSLLIEGDSASYDLATNKLNIYEVDNIKISNLSILPDSNDRVVRISKDAHIEPLNNAEIILSRYTKLHKIYDATVELISSNEVNATGKYTYKNELNEEKVITIDRIIAKEFYSDAVGDNTIQNRAYGDISEDDPLLFVGGLDYYGKVGLVENKKVARFKDGNARLHIPGVETQWFGYESTNDDDESDSTAHVTIDNSLISTDEKLPLITGLFFDEKNGYMYNSFIERPDGYRKEHRKFFNAEGRLEFESTDGTSNQGIFHIKPKEYYMALESGEEPFYASIYGNWYSFDHKRNEILFRGSIDLLKPNEKEKVPVIKTSAEGVALHEIDDISMSASFAIGPKLSSKVSGTIMADMRSNKEEAERVLPEDYEIDSLGDLNHQIVPLFSPSQFRNYLNGHDIVRLLSDYIVILDNDIVWDPENSAFHSKGERIKLLSAFGDDINTVVDGFIEIPKDESRGEGETTDNVINVFLEGPTGTWYYIRQDNGELSIFSSNKTFMAEIKKQSDVKPGSANQTFKFLEWYYNTYKDGMEIPSKYDNDLSTSMDAEDEEEFGNDFEGVDDEAPADDDDSIDSMPVEDEDDGDDF